MSRMPLSGVPGDLCAPTTCRRVRSYSRSPTAPPPYHDRRAFPGEPCRPGKTSPSPARPILRCPSGDGTVGVFRSVRNHPEHAAGDERPLFVRLALLADPDAEGPPIDVGLGTIILRPDVAAGPNVKRTQRSRSKPPSARWSPAIWAARCNGPRPRGAVALLSSASEPRLPPCRLQPNILQVRSACPRRGRHPVRRSFDNLASPLPLDGAQQICR